MAALAQAPLLATALYKAGLWQYALPAHAIHIAAAIWLLAKASNRRRRPVARAG